MNEKNVIKLYKECSLQLDAYVNESATNKKLSYLSNNEAVVINENGLITANDIGTAAIVIKPEDANSTVIYTFVVIVEEDPMLSIDNSEIKIGAGRNVTLSGSLRPENEDAIFTWTLNEGALDMLESQPDLTKSSLTLTLKNDLAQYDDIICTLTVNAGGKTFTAKSVIHPIDSSGIDNVSIQKVDDQPIGESTTLNLGETLSLKAIVTAGEGVNKNVRWTTSNESIVSIEETDTGINLYAQRAGSAVICAYSVEDAGYSASIIINVTGSETMIKNISLSVDSNILEIGDTAKARVTINPDSETEKVMFTSSAPDVASISNDGIITGLKTGTASIIVTSLTDPSKSDAVLIKVVEPEPIPVEFVSFTLKSIDGSQGYNKVTIDTENRIIHVTVPLLTNREKLIAEFVLSQSDAYAEVGNTIQESGISQNNFASPLTYVLSDAKGNKTEYTVNVEFESISGEDASFTSFKFKKEDNEILDKDYEGTINGNEIIVLMDKEIDISNLIADFTTSDTLTVNARNSEQISGQTENSYQDYLIYSLYGTNKKTINYIVKIDQGPILKTLSLKQDDHITHGLIMDQTVTFEVNEQEGFDLTRDIIPVFETKSTSEVNIEGLDFVKEESLSTNRIDVYKAVITLTDGRGTEYQENYELIFNVHKDEKIAALKSFEVTADLAGDKKIGSVSLVDGYVFIDVPYDADLKNVYIKTTAEPIDADILFTPERNENFTSNLNEPTSLTISAEGYTSKTYTVVVRRSAVPNERCELKQLVVFSGEDSYEPTKYGDVWIYNLPFEADLSQLKIHAEAEDGMIISIDDEIYNADKIYNLTQNNELKVIVQKEGMLPSETIIRIQKSKIPSNQCSITSFSLKKENEVIHKKSVISDNLILVTVPFGTDLSSVNYDFTSDIEGLVLSVKDGDGNNDFDFSSGLITLTAHAEGYADKTYSLIIQVENSSVKISKVTIAGIEVMPDEQNQIIFTFPRGTDLTQTVPEFTLSDGSANIYIDSELYTNGEKVDLRTSKIIVTELNGIKEIYTLKAIINYDPQFTGKITISQEIKGESGSETITLIATPDNENGTVIFEAETDKFDFAEPFTIVYTATDGSILYEGETAISSGSTITLSTLEKSFILKNESDESVYMMKIIEKAGSIIDINKFDLINVPDAGMIHGRIDHDRKQIYLDVLVEYTEDFTSMTLDIEADADMILVNGKLINGPVTLDLSKPVNVTFMKNGEVITYEVITSSVIDGPYVTVFEILDTTEGTLTGTIDNKNKTINVVTPMSIAASDLDFVNVNIKTTSKLNNSPINITGDYYDGYMMLDSLTSAITLVQDGMKTNYTVNIVRPFINGDMNGDGLLTSSDLIILATMIGQKESMVK